MRRKSLIRAFIIYSVIAFLITGMVLTYFIRNHIKNDSIMSVTKMTEMNLDFIIKPEITKTNFDKPFSIELLKNLNEKYSYLVKKGEMTYINIWNTKGALLYSNNRTLTNGISSMKVNFKYTLNNKTTYNVSVLNSGNNEMYIKIFVPIVYKDNVIGVYEEIKSYKEIEMHLSKVTNIILVTVFIGLMLLYFLLLRIIYNKQRKRGIQMKLFKNMKIAQKLICCFLLISLLMAVVGGAGILQIKKMNSNSTSMYQDNLIHLSKVSALKENFLQIHSNLLSLLTS